MKKLLVVVGTRPNFMKVTRFKEVAAARGDMAVELVHTGQHFDESMSTVFFDQFGLRPDHWLNIPQGTPTSQMAQVMLGLEPLAKSVEPDAMVVVGDVNSTFAAALTANKMGIPIVHIESGLRNGDMGMPEEINRILTDRIAQHFMITEPSGRENLLKEGADEAAIHMVGNTMIDSLVAFEAHIQSDPILEELKLGKGGHVLMTIHRPATVDVEEQLLKLMDLVAFVAKRYRVVFPMHPRTTKSLERIGVLDRLRAIPGVLLTAPMAYFAFQKLVATSAVVITDSGGIQEETTFRRIPCLTLRASTERPCTIIEGSNELMPFDLEVLARTIDRIADGSYKKGSVPALWDGRATERIMDVLQRVL